ncbi:hypothetical protein ACJJTC_012835 [Scirpophaga incertulas]
METPHKEKNKKKSQKKLKKDSAAYLRQREKANARKRKFLDRMTEEQREIKRAKDREYYKKKKAEKKVKNIANMTNREKRQQRKDWKIASKKYREKKKALINMIRDTPPQSDDELAVVPSVRRQVGRKSVRKDRAKAYRKIKKQGETIVQMKRKIESLKKKLQRKEAKMKAVNSPNKSVDALIKDIPVPPEVRKRLLYSEVLNTQLQEKANTFPKNSKEREVFHKCISGDTLRKYKLLHMAKRILPTRSKGKNDKSILKSDVKLREIVLKPEVRQKVTKFFERDDVSRMCPAKRDCLKKNGIKKQKRVLLNTVKDLTPKFAKETGINLSYPTLLRAKPFWVVAPKSKDRETCLCVKHENFSLKFNKLKNLQELPPGSIEKFIEHYACDVTSYECMRNLCEKCNNPEFELGDNNADSLTYFQWKSVYEEKIIKGEKKTFKITKKVPISSTVKELKTALFEDIPVMKIHLYGIYIYNKLKKELKENLTENESEVIIKLYQYEHFQKELKLPTISRLLNISSIESEDVSMSVIESPFVEEPIEDVWKDYVNLKDRPSIYKTVYNSSSSDDEDLMTISVRQQKDTSNVDASTSYGKESVHINLISPGTYLLIKVPTQKANIYYRYVATCQSGVDHDDGEILVTFLRSVRNNTRKFKLEVKDVSYINFDQIISIIPTPVLKKEHNREYYYFDRDIDVYEKN